MNKYCKLLFLLIIVIMCSSCNTQTSSKEEPIFNESTMISDTLLADMPQKKADELNGSLLVRIDYGANDILAAVYYDSFIDYWHFSNGSDELIATINSGILSNIHTIHEENGVKSLVSCGYAPGLAYPASVISIVNEKVIVSSLYNDDNEELYYCKEGDIICGRGTGISAGSTNVIPYYWNKFTNKYEPYCLTEKTADEVKKLDTDNIVTDIDKAISAYKRDNGLIHINYTDITTADINSTIIASKTYVITDKGLREYNINTDMRLGFYIDKLSVTE